MVSRTLRERYSFGFWLLLLMGLVVVCVLGLCVGSVNIPLRETIGSIIQSITGLSPLSFTQESAAILLAIRLPRVLLAALVGASLSIAGAAMQGLIRNPLADGSTLGVTSGGSLGAVVSIATGFALPGFPRLSITVMSIFFAFLSLLIILAFAHSIDPNMSSNTIILAGVIFSMLTTSLTSLVIAFSGEAVKQIVFWSMGSLAGRGYSYVALLAVFAAGGIIMTLYSAHALDVLAMGEEQAIYAGVSVKTVRLRVLVCVAVLCGSAVSVCGNIAFVGLAIPHIIRLIIGPAHSRLLPASALGGAIFLVLCDLISRILLRPIELPIGVLTSIFGAAVFIVLFYRQRKKGG